VGVVSAASHIVGAIWASKPDPDGTVRFIFIKNVIKDEELARQLIRSRFPLGRTIENLAHGAGELFHVVDGLLTAGKLFDEIGDCLSLPHIGAAKPAGGAEVLDPFTQLIEQIEGATSSCAAGLEQVIGVKIGPLMPTNRPIFLVVRDERLRAVEL